MEENSYKQKVLKKAVIMLVLCCFVALTVLNLCCNKVLAYEEEIEAEQSASRTSYTSGGAFEDILPNQYITGSMARTSVDNEFTYLSDLDYITENNWSYVGWGSIRKDLPPEGSIITLKVNGQNKIFLKGMGFHATAQLTYDISELSGRYTRFVSKAGVDASRGTTSTTGVWFRVQVSNDGSTWTNLITKSDVVNGVTDALDIDVNIEGYKYLRIYADSNGNNTADHAVLGGAKLVTEDYVVTEDTYDKIHPLEYYDEILGSKDADYNYNNNYRLILERELVRKIGYDTIVTLVNFEDKYRSTFDWLLSSDYNIEQVIEVGELSSGFNFAKVLADLYSEYKDELVKEDWDVYTKMMIGLAAAYTTDTVSSPLTFSNYAPNYDYVERYGIMKDIYDEGLFLYGNYFKSYHIELFRNIMNVAARNDELRWVNYRGKATNYSTSAYGYGMAYVTPIYNKPELWAEENREKYDTKWHLSEYGVPYGDGIQRLWMVQERGGICWNMSRNVNIELKMMGRPSINCFQPTHEAAFYYIQNADGTGTWGMANNIFGWGRTSTTWGGGNRARTFFNWANKSFTDQAVSGSKAGTSSGYVCLAQANLNNYEAYKKSLYLNLLANSYSDYNDKVAIYNKAIESSEINLDSYDYLIQSYKALNKTSAEWHELAEEIINNFKYYPMAFNDMLKVIRPYLDTADLMDIDQKEYAALNVAKVATADDIPLFYGVCKELATAILGKINRELATFSFDGENAGKIILSSEYDGRDVAWYYSLNGGPAPTSKEPITEHNVTLSAEEIASINTENDIRIYIVGLSLTDPIYTIDIKESTGIPSTVYANDWENRFIASVPAMQWKYNETDSWTSFGDAEPDLTGDRSVIVRMGPTGVYVAGESSNYTFTADNQPDTRKYIPISHLSIHAYSTQSADSARPFYAPNAIDGNLNTIWHTDFQINVLQQSVKPYITIKLDEPKNISGLEFIQREYKTNDPDNIKNARAYVSMDGESWIEAGKVEECTTYGELYALSFEEPVYGQYVKLEMDTYNMFSSAAIINLYEDTTIVTLATFSFNGENAGKICLVDEFKGANWEYSLDAGTTWKTVNGDEYQLTNEELKQINVDNKIKVRLNGKEFTISIQAQTEPTISAYLSDLENRLIGIDNIDNLEWQIEGDTKWTSYSEEEPIVLGDTKLLIRKKATGMLIASDAVEFEFTDDNQPDTAKYVPIKHLSIESFSNTTVPSRGEEPEFAIDALPTTMWHTNRTTTTMKDPRWIVIELDEPRYISKIEYVKKAAYAYGILKDGTVSVSMDGETWEVAANIENLYNVTTPEELTASENNKDIVFAEPKQAKYIKIECTQSCDYVHGERDGVPMDYFFSAAMFNIFEDITKSVPPTAELQYSTEELTNADVTVTLVNPSTEITITNNNGSNTYTFTENGTFTFEFVNNRGIKGTATATVDWICKTLPTPTITYTPNTSTNGDVTVEVSFDRDGTRIVDENGDTIETIRTGDTYTYVFTENGEHEIKFVGPYGNASATTVTVDWIDKVAPVGTITYSSTNLSNQDVTATITFNEENVTVKDGNTHTFTENGEYIFEFEDAAGNTGTMTANVNWIDKTLPTAIVTYSTQNPTNEDVVATVTFDKEGVTVEGGNEYTFEENGIHEFNFVGPAGNRGVAIAKVDWIDKDAPVGTITYSTEHLTNENVIATITFNEEDVTITNNEGNNTFIFTENNLFTFEFVDKVGNVGRATAQVLWIDRTVPIPTITYSINDITNQDVIATVTFDKENVKIVDDLDQEIVNGNIYTFEDNGTHEFKFIGPAGNRGTAVATVTWIDKIPPAATITYSTTEPTNGNVIATVTFDEGGVTIVNDQGEAIENGDTYVFTQNGTHTFNYVGPLGNLGTAVATVTWINKEDPIEPEPIEIIKSESYIIEDGYISNIMPNTTVKQFNENVETSEEIVFTDKEGNVLNEDSIITTDTVIHITDKAQYTLVVLGDIDGDGEITINDIALMKLHIIEISELTESRFKAADINQNNDIEISDMALLKLILLGLIFN